MADSDSPRLHVLLVEDDPINLKVLKRQIERLDCTVSTAVDGQGALETWQAGGIDLILTDCRMPGMSGYDLCRAIRQAETESGGPSGRRTPIIAVSGNTYSEEREALLAADMDDHLLKPVEREALERVLQHWCR